MVWNQRKFRRNGGGDKLKTYLLWVGCYVLFDCVVAREVFNVGKCEELSEILNCCFFQVWSSFVPLTVNCDTTEEKIFVLGGRRENVRQKKNIKKGTFVVFEPTE